MAQFKDIQEDADGDLLFNAISGDFSIDVSDEQDIEQLLMSFPGAYKEFPLVGVGVQTYINGSGVQPVLKTVITTQLTADGFTNIEVSIDPNNTDNILVNAIRN